jgi:uncharacterized protein (TIGR00369 family)
MPDDQSQDPAASRTGQGFGALAGIRMDEMEDGRARVVLDAADQHLNPHGTVHGGMIATLCDTAMGAAVVAAAPDDESPHPVTIELKVTYLEPATPGEVVATATVRKRGKRITVVEAEVSQGGDVVALALGTFTSG